MAPGATEESGTLSVRPGQSSAWSGGSVLRAWRESAKSTVPPVRIG